LSKAILAEHYLEINLKALDRYNKPLSKEIRECSLDNYHVFYGDDNLAVDIIDKKRSDTIYIDPLKETEDVLKDIENIKVLYPIMYFFGIGNGILFKALLNNEHHKRIIIIEPEIEILKIALGCVDLSEELSSLKLIILKSDSFTYGQAFDLVMNSDFKVYAKLYNMQVISNYYLNNYGEEVKHINQTMTKAIKQMVYSHGNDASDSLMGVDHHLKNIPDMIKSHTYLDFVHKKNSDIAVIVSTGPSLDKQLPLLKKIQNHITIISPDASLALLEKADITPDIVVSLERTEIVSTLFDKVSKKFQKDIVFLLASVLHKKSIKSVKGKNKIICMRPFGYTFYFEDLKEWGYHGIGMSVSNMAHELAFIMKYKKVVLIGQDLSYGKDGESHSTGNVYGKNQRSTDEFDTQITAYGGEGTVRSYTGWILFKNYFEKAIEDTKATMNTYNATEGGARINGAIEIGFQEFIDKHIDKEFVKAKIKLAPVRKEHSKAMLKRSIEYIDDWIDYAQKTKDSVEKVFLEVAAMCEKIEKAQEKKDVSKLDFDLMVKLSDKISEKKALFQDAHFSKLFFDVLQSYIIHQEFDLAGILVMHPKNDQEKRDKLIQWIMAHKYWLFSLAGGVNAVLEVVKRSKEHMVESLKNDYA
jgi:hypothetical protein